jgi:hypothetical protein
MVGAREGGTSARATCSPGSAPNHLPPAAVMTGTSTVDVSPVYAGSCSPAAMASVLVLPRAVRVAAMALAV